MTCGSSKKTLSQRLHDIVEKGQSEESRTTQLSRSLFDLFEHLKFEHTIGIQEWLEARLASGALASENSRIVGTRVGQNETEKSPSHTHFDDIL